MGSYALFFLMLSAFLGLTLLCVKSMGSYMTAVMEGKPNLATRVGGPVEGLLYRVSGVDARDEMAWPQYAAALLLFNVLGAVIVYALQRLQFWLKPCACWPRVCTRRFTRSSRISSSTIWCVSWTM
jgi:K+-transporting ATPase A subunit